LQHLPTLQGTRKKYGHILINNKLLTCGTQLQLIPLGHVSFCSHHIPWNQKSLQYFKQLPSLTSTCISWKLLHYKTRKVSPFLAPLTKFGSVATLAWLIVCMTMEEKIASAEFQELLQSYGIQSKLTTVKNPQANGILKCIPRVI
jgi:hypothetical protein